MSSHDSLFLAIGTHLAVLGLGALSVVLPGGYGSIVTLALTVARHLQLPASCA